MSGPAGPAGAVSKDFAQALMGAEADTLCGAAYGERSAGAMVEWAGLRVRCLNEC